MNPETPILTDSNDCRVVIIGAGFTGLTAGYELAKRGIRVSILEAEPDIGGLAAAFTVSAGTKLDRFYHHWFTNDKEVMDLIDELGLAHLVEINPTNTGIYYANNFFKLSTPLDLLKFKPISLINRIRLGLLTLRARRVKDWRSLESKSAHEWLREIGGESVYKVVWQPLLKGKFGPYAEDVSAVWFWNKLKLRGGSRGKQGDERLAYLKGSFVELANALSARIISLGGEICTRTPVTRIEKTGDGWSIMNAGGETYTAQQIIATTALPILADMIESWAPQEYLSQLRRIKYIGNICLVLELKQPLSQTYWLNVNDPSFPFVGVIEHTNFESADAYGGKHIVYLSKYLPHTDPLYSMTSNEFLEYALPYLQQMFPTFNRNTISAHYLWRARWSQPVVEKHYSQLISKTQSPEPGLTICSMAQIYPEDRGTNYAVREGKRCGTLLADKLLAYSK